MDIKDILGIYDIDKKISYLKEGRGSNIPDHDRLYRAWNPDKHDIMNLEKITIVTEPERTTWDESSGRAITIPAKTKKVDPNKISLPIEQDIVNIHTAFTVGTPPKIEFDISNKNEEVVRDVLLQINKHEKIKYKNRQIVRAFLAESEVAECWYIKDAGNFWDKLKAKNGDVYGSVAPEKIVKSVIWSPFNGDKLYPFFDKSGDMVAFSREYRRRNIGGKEEIVFTTYTDRLVYTWVNDGAWREESVVPHGFKKIPIIYASRRGGYCDKIYTMRDRLEKLLSGYADCVDYHFFPILKLFGDVERMSGEMRNRVVELTGQGADAAYLTWNQSSEPIRVEADKLIEQIYGLTNTPRITFENLKGAGSALSGVAFKYAFMGAHMAVENHSEVIGEFMQRRTNLQLSAIGTINSYLEKPSLTIDSDTQIVPYMIDDIEGKVRTAVTAVDGSIWSKKHAITFVGNVENVDSMLKEIEEDRKMNAVESAF